MRNTFERFIHTWRYTSTSESVEKVGMRKAQASLTLLVRFPNPLGTSKSEAGNLTMTFLCSSNKSSLHYDAPSIQSIQLNGEIIHGSFI